MARRSPYLLPRETLVIPPRIAALIERQTNVSSLRVRTAGVDPEAYEVLDSLRAAAATWLADHGGTRATTGGDIQRQPAGGLEWLSTGDVAKALKISRAGALKAMKQGRLEAHQDHGQWFASREALEHWRAVREGRG